MRRILRLAAAGLAVAGLAAAVTPAAQARTVPFGFFSVNYSGQMYDPLLVDADQQSALMAKSGAETVRASFFWFDLQPYATFAQVPAASRADFTSAGGRPISFASTDRIVRAAARHGLRVLPVVSKGPRWARETQFQAAPPKRPADYAALMRALIGRYGPRGSFWRANPAIPKTPIRAWIVWNEPNSLEHWRSRTPWPRGYVRLLKAARAAIKSADPGARVISAGLFGRAWLELAKIYAAGGKGAFDAVSIHPYTKLVSNVVRILRSSRDVMRQHGDSAKPMYASELTWPASIPDLTPFLGYETTRAGQARKLSELFPELVRLRSSLRLAAVSWEAWIDGSTQNPFNFTGLRTIRPDGSYIDRPALTAYRTTTARFEGCAKSDDARRCAG